MTRLAPDFIPMTRRELKMLSWDGIDILLITGDAYVDHPSFGIAVIGRLLLAEGYRVGIIAQPDWKNAEALKVLGRPRLACAITSGNMDSMVNIYTAARRLRRSDSFSPDGQTGMRPPHALAVYSQLAKKAFPGIPVVVGGIEASLRRIAHYDYWQDKLRPSVLMDTKADILVYGMGEKAVLDIFKKLSCETSLDGIRGTARLLGKRAAMEFECGDDVVEIPSFEEHKQDRDALMQSTITIESEMNPYCGKTVVQRYGERLLVIAPQSEPASTAELDEIFALPYSGRPHPSYNKTIPAFETIQASVPAVRGCPGGCSFCGLVSHQGRFVSYRSEQSIVDEVKKLAKTSTFRGTVSDIGGAAGNIYGNSIKDSNMCKKCRRVSCLFPKACSNYVPESEPLIKLLKRVRNIEGVKHVFINSGIRLELAMRQKKLMRELIHHHVSGHLKVAPEHLDTKVVKLMRKDPPNYFYDFMKLFEDESKLAGKEQYIIPLFISNFPGCTTKEMKVVDDFLNKNNWSPQQVQDFIPLPMTMAAAMYYTGKTPEGDSISVNRGLKERRPQLDVLKKKRNKNRRPRTVNKNHSKKQHTIKR